LLTTRDCVELHLSRVDRRGDLAPARGPLLAATHDQASSCVLVALDRLGGGFVLSAQTLQLRVLVAFLGELPNCLGDCLPAAFPRLTRLGGSGGQELLERRRTEPILKRMRVIDHAVDLLEQLVGDPAVRRAQVLDELLREVLDVFGLGVAEKRAELRFRFGAVAP
jgi:hypothetical protein